MPGDLIEYTVTEQIHCPLIIYSSSGHIHNYRCFVGQIFVFPGLLSCSGQSSSREGEVSLILTRVICAEVSAALSMLWWAFWGHNGACLSLPLLALIRSGKIFFLHICFPISIVRNTGKSKIYIFFCGYYVHCGEKYNTSLLPFLVYSIHILMWSDFRHHCFGPYHFNYCCGTK